MTTLCEWCVLRHIHKNLTYIIHNDPEPSPRIRLFKQNRHKNNVPIYTMHGKWATSFHNHLDNLLNLPQNIAFAATTNDNLELDVELSNEINKIRITQTNNTTP